MTQNKGVVGVNRISTSTSELEAKLRSLAANGELTYLSLTPVAGKGDHNVVFHAVVSPASRFGNRTGRDADPVKAILAALGGLPKSFVKEIATRVEREPWDVVT